MTLTIAEEKLEEVRQKLQFWIDDASLMTFKDCESLLGQLFHVCKCALLIIIIIIIVTSKTATIKYIKSIYCKLKRYQFTKQSFALSVLHFGTSRSRLYVHTPGLQGGFEGEIPAVYHTHCPLGFTMAPSVCFKV